MLLIPAELLPTLDTFLEETSVPEYSVFGIMIRAEYEVETPLFEINTLSVSFSFAPILKPSTIWSGFTAEFV